MSSNNNVIAFDELDRRCVKELPVIIDVIASTFNKIRILFQIYDEDLQDLISKKTKSMKGWGIKEAYHVFRPFNSDIPKNGLSELKYYFAFWYNIEIIHKSTKITDIKYNFYMGYELLDDVDYENYRTFSFGIERFEPVSNYNDILIDKTFQSKVELSKEKFMKVKTHESDNHYCQHMLVSCDELNKTKLDKTYNHYKNKLVIPFLKSL